MFCAALARRCALPRLHEPQDCELVAGPDDGALLLLIPCLVWLLPVVDSRQCTGCTRTGAALQRLGSCPATIISLSMPPSRFGFFIIVLVKGPLICSPAPMRETQASCLGHRH